MFQEIKILQSIYKSEYILCVLSRFEICCKWSKRPFPGPFLFFLNFNWFGTFYTTVQECDQVCQPVLDILKDSEDAEIQEAAQTATVGGSDLHTELIRRCVDLDKTEGPSLIQQQKERYALWNQQREQELQRQYENLQRAARVEAITQTKLQIEKEEQKLFFFDDWDR